MTETLLQWFRSSRARALAFGAALVLVLALAGCSEEGDSEANGGSDSDSASQESTQQAPTEETTSPPATSVVEETENPEEQRDSEEERPQQSSTEDAAPAQAESEQQPGQGSTAPQESDQQESEQEGSALSSRGQIVTVTRVVDGDTIEVSPAVDGIQDVRLIGVDTPETYGGTEPLGEQASSFATEALAGQEVSLEFDEERVDPYDRALAYVWVSGGGMFNAQLLREGLAQVATFPPNTKYVNRFESIQAEARAAGIGIWRLSQTEQCELANRDNGIGEGSPECTGTAAGTAEPAQPQEQSPAPTPQPSSGNGGSAPPVSEDDCPGSHPIKGNEDSGIYHPPSGGSYSVTNPEVCFASPNAAEAAGYRAAQN